MKALFFATIITSSTVISSHGATILAQDDFSSGDLTGGPGWENSWSGGSVVNGALNHVGNNPQQINRTISDLGLSNVAQGEDAGTYSVQVDVGLDLTNYDGMSAVGFRIFQNGPTNGTFAAAWKNDINNGQLTFFHQDSPTGGAPVEFVIPGAEWQLTPANSGTFDDLTYQFIFDSMALGGQNPDSFTGSYVAQVNAIDSSGAVVRSITTPELGWINNPNALPIGQISQIQFQNTAPNTTAVYDNITVTDMATIVPEPSTALLCLGSLLVGFRRRRG